ncbi:DUF996 domain-containing protein [Thermotoga sp. KOL6]|uniref:DUF996 domain-containing protein n=1 Tax=Thermotoga sp. KOL6 TaxID=126741 RepID=UPI000C779A40|nr:DUF996 domain-containing protein [Thermotoga sp. KOL6]PLV60329.1 hypothetical protein AS005_03350 [Thermotoga sp. KOL6]
MNLSTAKIMAGVGLILGFFGAIPAVGWIFSLIGTIFFLMGIYNISQITGERRIFNFLLIPAILLLIASFVYGVFLAAALFVGGIFASGVALFGFLVIVVLGIVALVYKVKAYRLLAEVLKVPIFNIAASFYKWGAILMIVFGVGLILMFIGDILALIGFFSVPAREQA